MLHAVIMAGGAGTRFWPESRQRRPKQLLPLVGERSMIQATVDRLGGLVAPDRLLVVTGADLAEPIAEQLPTLPKSGLLVEPCRRDTAPCIGLAAVHVAKHDPDATMVVLPADHVIGPDNVFRDALSYAAQLVETDPSRLVTFGIKPSYPAESFGYIERGESLAKTSTSPATFRVVKFHEKPKADVAHGYVESGKFYWNSGIFVWKAATVLAELARHEPAMHAGLQTIAASIGTPSYVAVLEREFTALPRGSIDFAVMERAKNVAVVEAPFSWDDVGSWQALARLEGQDDQGNTIVGRHVGVDTTGTIVHARGEHLVATLGCRDLLVVHTPDATLVANKHDEESIRKLVALLAERGWLEYL